MHLHQGTWQQQNSLILVNLSSKKKLCYICEWMLVALWPHTPCICNQLAKFHPMIVQCLVRSFKVTSSSASFTKCSWIPELIFLFKGKQRTDSSANCCAPTVYNMHWWSTNVLIMPFQMWSSCLICIDKLMILYFALSGVITRELVTI